MTDEEKLKKIDLTANTPPTEDMLWALNYLLNMPDEDIPLFE